LAESLAPGHDTLMPYAIILGVFLFVGVAWWIHREKRRQRREALRHADFPAAWEAILNTSMPLYNCLPEDLRKELHGHIQVFLDEKTFTGCGGQEITDEVRVTIAAQACMLLLNSPGREYKTLRSIMVYPGGYGARSADDSSHDGTPIRLGESWVYGPVVLAWDAVEQGAADIHDGHNVVLHEFAHQLDQADGQADGAPDLGTRSRYVAWARVLGAEYKRLQKKARKGKRHVMDRYGATNPAEFFAVATETFFEKSKQLKKKHPELYDELKMFYHCDPLEWTNKD
jgi:Mlc titration factor MtfA (ptsG expression regulator)